MAQAIFIPRSKLKDLYKKKRLTTYEIADIYNCCQGTIWKRLEKYGIRCLPNGRRSFVISKSKLRDLYIKQRLSSRKIAKIYECAYSTIDYKIKKYKFPTRTLAAAHITTLRKNFSGNKTDKAYIIGFAIGDLRVRKVYPNSETISVDCGSTQREQIQLISKLFNSYGNVWISKPNKRDAVQIECSLNESFNFLLKKRKLIDLWILENKRFFGAFLAGFTDAEGCISISKNMAYYSLGNYNKKLLTQIHNFLVENKIPCSKLVKSNIKGKLCFKKYFHNQDYWQLRICTKKSLILLFDLIGPYLKHGKRVNDMKRAIGNIIFRNKKYGNINMN